MDIEKLVNQSSQLINKSKFQEALKEKFANPDSPDFKEGGHDKRDEAKERRERGLPPMDTPPPTNKEGKPYLWHAGSHHWVTPEYMKLHPDIGAGAVKGLSLIHI